MTARHLVDHVTATEGLEGLKRCYFHTQTLSPVAIPLLFEQSAASTTYILGPTDYPYDDYALVRLERPVTGAVPIEVVSTPPATGEPFLVIAAFEYDLPPAKDPDVPVATIAYVRAIGRRECTPMQTLPAGPRGAPTSGGSVRVLTGTSPYSA